MKEEGTITLWVLGLAVAVLFLGGLALDLWRVFEVRQQLAVMADSAAVAGATHIDEELFRSTGTVAVEPDTSTDAALASLANQEQHHRVTAAPLIAVAGATVSVSLTGEVNFTFLRLFLHDEFTVSVVATAAAVTAP